MHIASCAGHTAWVLCVAASPDGVTFATGSSDKTVKIWDMRKHQTLHTFTRHDDQVRGLTVVVV